MSKVAVVSFGGSALLRPNQRGLPAEQIRNADEICRAVLPVLEEGYGLVLVHGSGPQTENALLQAEEAANKIPPADLDMCLAGTQGSVGYLLEAALQRQLELRHIPKKTVCVLTAVLVDLADRPKGAMSEPVGPWFTPYRAHELMRREKWEMLDEAGSRYRRVVPLVRPEEILSSAAVRKLVHEGYVVIAAGGGGVPVARDEEGLLSGVEAVVDKDYAAALLAAEIGAEFLLMLTPGELSAPGKEGGMEPISELTAAEALRHLEEGTFRQSGMHGKIEAALLFIRRGGREVLITSARKVPSALMGRSGTRIFDSARRLDKSILQKQLPFRLSGSAD